MTRKIHPKTSSQGHWRWLRGLLWLIVTLYTLAIVAWYSSFCLFGDRVWFLAMVNAFALYLFAPLPAILLGAALLRRRTAWGIVLIPTLLFLSLFGADLLPPLPIVYAYLADGPAVTVMTYNVLYTNTDAEPIAATVTDIAPDVIAFQELTPSLAQQLVEQVGARYPYRTPLHSVCHAEVAIWSRFSLREEPVDQEILCRVRSGVLEIEGRQVRLVAVHAWPYTGLDRASIEQSFQWRHDQTAWILSHFVSQPEPIIVLGDLNSTPTHQVYQMFVAELNDAFREAGWGWGHTFPASGGWARGIPYPSRLVRIDHIFYSDDWLAEAAWVGAWDGASDHRPVIARLRMRSR